MAESASLLVRRLDTGVIVHTVPLRSTSEGYVERVLRGMLRNLNTDEYYVDDSELDEKD